MHVKHITKSISINTVKMMKSRWAPIVVASLMSAILCLYLYGLSIMNPTNTMWLYANGDISQHQIGWDFFRNDSWRLPLGSIGNLAYPAGTSLVYMDSIPLAAIIMKAFNPILPEHFQYFGLWGLLSFVLMGFFSALIIRRYTKNPFLIVVGALLITISPVFLMRTYAHTALASQWIILAGINLILYRDKIRSDLLSVGVWAMLFVIAVTVHPYFVPMSMVLLLAYLILRRTKFIMFATHYLVAFISFVSAFWLVGGFVTKDVGTATLGMFGADINAIINPLNFSYFIKPLPTTQYAYEGLAYVGIGIYVLLFISLALALFHIKSVSSLKSTIQNRIILNKRSLIVIVVILLSVLIAIGPVWYLNGKHILTISIPDSIAQFMSIFRSTGRFMWIASYALSIFAVISVIKWGSNKNRSLIGISILLTLLLAIQFIDVTKSEGMKTKIATIRKQTTYHNRFDTESVRQIISAKKHIAYVENTLHATDFFELGAVVALQGATINDGYISRKPVLSVNRETAKAHNALITNKLAPDTAYITNRLEDIATVRQDPSISIVQIDQTWIIAQK